MAGKIFILFCCVFAWSFCAFGNETIKSSIELKVLPKLPPQARTSGTTGSNMSGVRDNWLDMDIRFRTNNIKDVKKRFLDNPELHITVVAVEGKRSILFNGIINYMYIEQDGKNHYMKALLPAPFLRRHFVDLSIDRIRFLVKGDIKQNGKILATVYGSNKPANKKDLQALFQKIPNNIPMVPDSVCGRDGTTWSIIDVNKYEYEKNK